MSRSKKTIVMLCVCVLMICNCTLSVCAEVYYGYDYTTATAPVQYNEPDITFFENSSEYENYSYKVRICTISTRTESSYVEVVQTYNTIYSASPIVFYVDENGCFCSYSEGEQLGNSVKVSFNNTLSADGYVRHYKGDISYVSCSSFVHNVYKSNTDIDVEMYYNSDYIFDNLDSAKAYLETGKVENVLYGPYTDDLQEDVTQGFNQFNVRRLHSTDVCGGYGGLITYDIPSYIITDNTYIVYDITFSVCLGVQSNSNFKYFGDYIYDDYNFVVQEKITESTGQYVVDFVDLLQDNNYVDNSDISVIIKSMVNYCYSYGISWDFNNLIPGNCINADILSGDLAYSYAVDILECNIVAYLVTDNVKSKSQYGYVDLVSGQNESMSVSGDTLDLSGNVIAVGSTLNSSDLADVEKKLNADGTVSYVDVTVNVDTGGVGATGNVIQNNNVSIPDTINVNLNSGSSSSSDNVVIEDDDYSLQSITNLIDGAGGFFDDLDTEKNDDGFLALLSGFFGSVDSDLGYALGAGMGSTIIICILRSLLKR